MGFHYLFFDLDGTLIDARVRLHALFSDLTGDDNISFEEYWSHKCAKKSNQWVLKEIFGYSDDRIQVFLDRWMRLIEDESYLVMDTLFEDTVSSLEMLHGRREIYVVSARQFPRNAENQLKRLGIAHFFEGILITEQKRSKEELIRSLGLELTRSNSMIVGDTGEEILAGRALGMYAVNTLTGFRNRKILESYRPDLIVNNLTELRDMLLHQAP